MQINLLFEGITPVTLNHAIKHGVRFNRLISYKSKEAKEFEKQMSSQLLKYDDVVRSFKEIYKDTKHYINMDFKFYIPIFTKKGTISKKSKDTSNMVKYCEDVICDYFGFNDSQVIAISACKIHSNKPKIVCNISVHDMELIK